MLFYYPHKMRLGSALSKCGARNFCTERTKKGVRVLLTVRLCGGDCYVWGIPGFPLSHVLWTTTTCLLNSKNFRRLAKIGILSPYISSSVATYPLVRHPNGSMSKCLTGKRILVVCRN